ncbi:MAG: type IV pili methyl-accepting chemotaxis transducer N-terminal domain-containing protein [Thiohalomonadales bacterium]
MKKRFNLFLVIIIFIASVNNENINAYGGITTVSSAINKAGRQRMLTQRMLKFYAMIGIGIDVLEESSSLQLKKEIDLYNQQLDELTKYSQNAKITHSLKLVTKLWLPYQKILTEPVSRKNAKWLIAKNNELLLASHNVVNLLHETSGTKYTKLVNISGRQRMLSQMLAKTYMLKVWGFDDEKYTEQTEQIKKEFKAALLELINAQENNQSIHLALNDVKAKWELLEFGLERNNKKPVPFIVAMMSEKILIKMNEITFMYENLSITTE